MIVSCPSCGTRYRHRGVPVKPSPPARCSGCEHVFPLRSSPRPYVIVGASGGGAGTGASSPSVLVRSRPSAAARVGRSAARAAPGAMSIGMDDPTIASQLERTALDDAPGTAMTYRLEAADRDSATRTAKGDAVEVAPSSPEATEAPVGKRPGAFVDFAGTVAAAVAGAGLGWWYSPHLIGEPRTWILAGAGLGLFVAWLGLRWTPENS